MKKNELISALERIAAQHEIAELTELIEQIRPANVSDGTKLHYFITVNERVLDPAQKYPKQMLICHDILTEHVGVGTEVSRQEVIDLIGEHAGLLHTRQDPTRIFCFYQKRMEDEGWLTRSKCRL